MLKTTSLCGVAAVLLLYGGHFAHAQADTVVVQWNDVTLQAIRDTHPAPTIAARALAVVDTCMYDA